MATPAEMLQARSGGGLNLNQFPSNPFAAPTMTDEEKEKRAQRRPTQKPTQKPTQGGPDIKIPPPIFAPLPMPLPERLTDIVGINPGTGINPTPPINTFSNNLPTSPIPINPSPTMGRPNFNTGFTGINLPGQINPDFAGGGGSWLDIIRKLRAQSMQPQPPIFNPNVSLPG